VRSGNTSFALNESGFDSGAFVGQELIAERLRRSLLSVAAFHQPTLVHSQHLAVRNNDCSLDDVLEFTDVAGPGVGAEQPLGFDLAQAYEAAVVCTRKLTTVRHLASSRHLPHRVFRTTAFFGLGPPLARLRWTFEFCVSRCSSVASSM